MTKRLWLVVVLTVLGALAMSSPAGARTKVVYAGGPAKWQGSLAKRTGAGVDNFLVNRITINVGDTVDWNGASLSSGFHTVDIPKLNGSDLALITGTGKTVQGVNDAAGNPFWFNGKVPVLSFNTALFGPSGPKGYNGTTRVDSGLPLGKPHDFKVKFLTPGTYKYFCDVHYGMHGVVVVKAKGASVPTAQQDAATLQGEERSYTAEAQRVDRTKVHGNRVSVGASGPGGVEVFAMFPSVLRIKAGTTVQFAMSKDTREVHTASFGPAKYLGPLAKSIAGAPAPSPAAIYPSDPPGQIVLSPGSHGNGFANTGLMDRDATTPLPAFGAIKFTQPGTYRYECLIHPFMHGVVIVK
jgi:plastocyanin